MRFILKGQGDPDWAPFQSAYKMLNYIKETEDTDELEDWMLEGEREQRAKQEQPETTHWTFPLNRRDKKRNSRQQDNGNNESEEEEKSQQPTRYHNQQQETDMNGRRNSDSH